jgi:hypothetical protein
VGTHRREITQSAVASKQQNTVGKCGLERQKYVVAVDCNFFPDEIVRRNQRLLPLLALLVTGRTALERSSLAVSETKSIADELERGLRRIATTGEPGEIGDRESERR